MSEPSTSFSTFLKAGTILPTTMLSCGLMAGLVHRRLWVSSWKTVRMISNWPPHQTDSCLGPCRISDDAGPKYHAESWNTNANIFFIDQPVGVGYSYADFGETVVCHSCSRSSPHKTLMELAEYVRRSRKRCCRVPRNLFRTLYPIQRAEIPPLRGIIRSE